MDWRRKKCLWIWLLTEKAHVTLTLLTSDTSQTYGIIKVALKDWFKPSKKQEMYKAEIENQRKWKKESWGDFGDELLQLVD